MKYDFNKTIDRKKSDSDLIMPRHKHNIMAEVTSGIDTRVITFTAASKTFNLAGFLCSNIIIKDPNLREAFVKTTYKLAITMPNIFGLTATEAAYNFGEEWLDNLLLYIHGNYNFLEKYISENMPSTESKLPLKP